MNHRQRFSRLIVAVLVAVMSLGVFGVQSAPAAANYTGGVYDYPRFIPNDHTAFALRYSATGLTPGADYYVKVRFTVNVNPSPSTNRGWTWNPTTETWIQESDAWEDFPLVTADGTGSVVDAAGWVFAKFGDDAKSGDYYVMVSLKPVLGGDTLNPSSPPSVDVMDMQTEGSWVHNGVAIASAGAKRAEATMNTSSTVVWGLSKTEANLIDDDSNGVIDDEDYGPATATGDIRLSVPASSLIDVLVKQAPWLDDVTSGAADTDIALGAGDTTPPSAPSGLTAQTGEYQTDLAWAAAAGATGYHVYRWTDAPVGAYYSPVHELVASVAGTTYTDTDVELGTTYYYEVRGYDDATNVGPRSNTDSAQAVTDATEDRIEGLTRYETAASISESAFTTATTVVLATGSAYPDALAAAGLAGVYDGPLLLTGTSTLPEVTTEEIERLGATDIIIVGGTAAVSQAVEDALVETYSVTRIAGATRYATAADVAAEIVAKSGATTAFFARGDGFADALAAGPYAFDQGLPILLVKPTSVPEVTLDAIDGLALTDGVVVGGTGAVSDDVFADLASALSGDLDRVSGATRYDTAVALADYACSSAGLASASYSFVGLATGQNFPDALSGGAAIGKLGGVMLLTKTDSLPTVTSDAITANRPFIETVTIFGGDGAVSQTVEDAVAQLLE